MNTSVLNAPESDGGNRSRLIFEQTERNVNDYISHVKKSEWTYHFNRVFISPGRSYNVKYIVKFLLSRLAQPKRTRSGTRVSSPSGTTDHPTPTTTPRQKRPGAAPSRPAANKSNAATDASKVDGPDLFGNEHEYDVCDVLDGLDDKEWFRLMNVDAAKRTETVVGQYRAFERTLAKTPLEKLDKLHCNVRTAVPYVVYTETAEDRSTDTNNWDGYSVNTVDGYDVLATLRTCGVVVIDVSRDAAALSKGRETFRSFRRELVADMDRVRGKRLIVVISTVMTWTGVSKGHVMYERDADSRTPNAQCAEHYEFELEVLAVNKTKRLKEIVTTTVVWTGITYGFEQDLLRFAFDSARRSAHDDGHAFPIPKSRNYVPIVHVENLARLVHRTISENHKLKDRGVFAVETPTYTLKRLITAIGKACDANVAPAYVSSDAFLNEHGLQGAHRHMLSMDVVTSPAVDRLWPDFQWYDGRPSSIAHKMKSLTGSCGAGCVVKKTAKILVLGPPASGKTELARELARRYGSVYLESNEIVREHIDKIKKELTALRKTYSKYVWRDNDDDDDDDDDNDQTVVDTVSADKMNRLENRLKQLYASMKDDDETPGDVHLIPLLKAEMSSAATSKRGYVMDGCPYTEYQARSVFGGADSRRTDAHGWPDLTVCLTAREPTRTDANVDDGQATGKKKVEFSDVIVTSSPPWSTASKSENVKEPVNEKTKRPAWNADEYRGLLKTLNRHYVPMKTFDCWPSADAVDEQLCLQHRNVSPSDRSTAAAVAEPDETSPTAKWTNVERTDNGPRRLCEKMTLLDELGKITDIDHVDRLLADEYLMRHVTPTLTKLLARVARVRPENAVEFLACAAVGQNPEGTAECPERSDEGVRIQRLLERAVRVLGDDDGGTLTAYLAEHSVAGPDETNASDDDDATPSSDPNSVV